jgi:receptor protein-tyrosine kinase
VNNTESQYFDDAMDPGLGPGAESTRDASASAWHEAEIDQPRPAAKAAPIYPIALLEPLRPSAELLFARSQDDARSEEIRKLRTELLLRAHSDKGGGLTLAVVGAGTGEGRSLLAAELALAFAFLGRPTLLVDADLRNPRQHALFGAATPGPGLIQAIMHADSPGLHSVEGFPSLGVLTAGDYRSSENPNELLSSGQFQRLIGALRYRFSCIIVDTPRFGAYSDAQIVAAVLGNVLCVARAGASRFSDTKLMLRDLESARATILGGVLNHF